VPHIPKVLRAAALGFALAALPVAQASARERPKNGVIAFAAQRAGIGVIYTRAPTGSHLRLLRTGTPADHPVFSPRGKRLLFTRRGPSGSRVWISYLDGTGLRPLTGGPSDGMAAWSPIGGQVVFARGRRGKRHLYKVFADGSGLRRLTFSPRDDISPTWSVKNRIAFVRSSGKHSSVYVMRADGGVARRPRRGRTDEVTPAWSPTGRTLALAAGKAGSRDLFLVSADGSHSRRLTNVAGDDSDPAWSPDGTRIVFTHKRGGRRQLYLMKVRGKPITRLPVRSARVRRLTTSGSRAGLPSWQPTGLAPMVAAAGDIACDPESPYFNDGLGIPGTCRQKLTSDLLLREDLTDVFTLGDNQYDDGQLSKFQLSFGPSWGRLKGLMHPVVGNHEYKDPNAAGYFDYFNGVGNQTGPAGDRSAGYYSLDVGSWHVIVLNSECEHVGGCGASTPQMTWLQSDLASHPAACTMALWHRPHFTSAGHTDDGDMLPAWNLLYNANADLILNGHEHLYERFAPQTPGGVFDPARGIREIIAGMGGRSRFGFPDIQPNSQFRSNSFYGVLDLALRDGGYDWTVVAAPTGRVVDSGSGRCH
jgi:acid phosphatase type 7